jgi:hypothetical protein
VLNAAFRFDAEITGRQGVLEALLAAGQDAAVFLGDPSRERFEA